jgi:hypothetical protein
MRAYSIILLLLLSLTAHASASAPGGSMISAGSPTAKVIEYLGEPTDRVGGFGCDCAGCRTEEQLYYRQDDQNLIFTVIDGRVTKVE